jgi:hypothetical protein
LEESAWRIRLNDSGFRWTRHVDRQLAGYRTVLDAQRFAVGSVDEVVRKLNERVMRGLFRARLIDTGPARESQRTDPLF